MTGRKPERLRMPREVGQPDGSRVADQQAQNAVPAWRSPDPGRFVAGQARGDEKTERTVIGRQQAECGVLAARHFPREVDHVCTGNTAYRRSALVGAK